MKRTSLLLAVLATAAVPAPAHAVAPSFTSYPAPAALGNDAGEPSIGADTRTGKVMYQAGLETLRVDFST